MNSLKKFFFLDISILYMFDSLYLKFIILKKVMSKISFFATLRIKQLTKK